MNYSFSLILNVSIASTMISIAIKYSGAILSIPATPYSALIAVFLPMVIVTIVLCLRSYKQSATS